MGLTGGIGAGKSAVAHRFRELGAHLLDADQLARELLAPDSEVLREVTEVLGDDLLDANGRLDRARLAERVFSEPEARRQLDAILHPRINALEAQRAAAIAARLPDAVVIYEAPLLLESGGAAQVDRIAVVDLPEQLQLERVHARGDRDPDQARAIMDAQLPRAERLQQADDVIDNSGSWNATKAQVDGLLERYREMARARGGAPS